MSQNTEKPTLLFCVLDVGPYGGGGCVTAWTLQALRRDWHVTILCATAPDFDGANQCYGTSLQASDFILWRLPFPLRHLQKIDPDPFSIQRLSWLMRFCQSRADDYDAVVSANDEFDFGRPGVQYIHYPGMETLLDVIRSAEEIPTGKRLKALLRGRLRPWLFVAGIQMARLTSNRIVTNSHWTAHRIKQVYGVDPQVLYPPVLWSAPPMEWAKRKAGFVALGRLTPDKRLMQVIDIVERVRSRGFAVDLEIVGQKDKLAGDAFIRQLRARIQLAGDWVRLHESVSRSELETIVSGSRYGIHAFQDEHFGIAVAEMLRAGCIVFVPDNGGQVEIVGNEPGLCYQSDDDAVEKICKILADETEQTRLREVLGEQSGLFSEKHFMDGMRTAVADFRMTPLPAA